MSAVSAIVLASGGNDAPVVTREMAARSLAWLVSAVVAGVVRDVVAACPPSWPVEDVMEQAGCALIASENEAERLRTAVQRTKCRRLLVLRFGFLPEGPLVEEIDAIERRSAEDDAAILLSTPGGLVQRLFPDRAPVVAVLVSRDQLLSGDPVTFGGLAHRLRGAPRLRTRLAPVF